MTSPGLIEVFADTRGRGQCRGCHAPITWAEVVTSGKKMRAYCADMRLPQLAPLPLIDHAHADGETGADDTPF